MNGHLRERPLAELIREIIAAKLSGALRLVRERVQAVVYAEAGEIVFASSNLRVHRLATSLRRWGALPEDQLSTLVTELMSDAEASAALIAAGTLTKDDLAKLQARQATDVLLPLLLWTEGEWSFDPRARLVEDVRCKLELPQLLLEAARQLPAEFVAARLSGDEEIISPVTQLPAQMQLQALEGFILSRVEAPLTLGELLAVSGLPEAQTRQCVYTLALGGFLTRASWCVPLLANASAQSGTAGATVVPVGMPPPVTEKQAEPESGGTTPEMPPDPRAEIDALFALVSDSDYYQMLGLDRTTHVGEIKRAYYALAKRFHPDRFQRDAGAALKPQIEAAFMQISQAYETLRDPHARAAYELKLGAQMAAPASSHVSNSADAAPPSDSNSTLSREQRADESFTQGLAALKQNDLSSAVTLLGEAARLAPQQPRYHAFYGSALARDVRTRRQAEAELQTAIKLDDNNPDYRVMLGELLHVLGQPLRAERELQRALALDPNHVAARRLLNQLRKTKRTDGK